MTNDFLGLKPNDRVIVTKMKHIVEVQYMERMNSGCGIQKLDKDTYVVKETGEVKEFNHIETRQDSLNSLRQTFKKLRYLINNNFSGKANELFVTLTYKGELQTSDTKKVYTDFKYFMDRLRYHFKGQSNIDYINVLEPHQSGNFHMHVLMRFDDLKNVYIPNDKLAEIWGNGFVTIQSLKDVDNIGAYLSAYLADIELTEENVSEVLRKGLEIKVVDDKKYVKGGRLHMYPPGVNLYRKSKGIEFPERQKTTYKNAKKIVGNTTPHYSKTYKIETDEFQNTIHFQQYNLKRQ